MAHDILDSMTKPVRELIDRATYEAHTQFYHRAIGVEHVLLAFVTKVDNPGGRLLTKRLGLSDEKLRPAVRHTALPEITRGNKRDVVLVFKPTLRDSLRRALELAREEKGPDALMRTDHVLRAIADSGDPMVERILRAGGADLDSLRAELDRHEPGEGD